MNFLQPFDMGYYTGLIVGVCVVIAMRHWGFPGVIAVAISSVFLNIAMRLLSAKFNGDIVN